MNAAQILARLRGLCVGVVGDSMLDRYLIGSVTRISPEAPVPVVLHERTEDRLGGAANVALNLSALGAKAILCSVIGCDAEGEALRQLLPEAKLTDEGLLSLAERPTTVKMRVLGNNQQMLRIDREVTHPLGLAEERRFVEHVQEVLSRHRVQALIFQDYNKGVLTPFVIQNLLDYARSCSIFTAVDPKRAHFFAYRGVHFFKPNLKEVRDSIPFTVEATVASLRQATTFLRAKLDCAKIMITLSEKGLFLDDEKSAQLYPTAPRKVADVSGAGDTVISVATLAMVAGLESRLVAALSNLAGGQVCEFPGVVPVQINLLEQELAQWLTQNEE
ncbi:MAG: bifunctional ADP-heptose synthase [Saprospiraceae bacterium]|nr:bifunctional ADP-heptose synthase [Saprospiraceae bacterium]MDW8482904.1 bifunctional ADP-heptose synthase [Saprospiraceae bacterium]